MTKVLVTGGTGSVGKRLCEFLSNNNFEVSILSRSRKENSKYRTYLWDYENALIEKEAIETADYIVHLAGAGIADKRWTMRRKKEILYSRTKTTELLYKVLSNTRHNVKCFIAASAVGYYGQTTSDTVFREDDPPGNDFVAMVCKSWEKEVQRIQELGIRTVNLRLGIVLMETGGALEKMAKPFHLNLGAALGSGNQIMPWIHYRDLNQIIGQAIHSTTMSGAYNCCSPETVNNLEFSRAIAKILDKTMWLPNVPSFMLKLLLGERAILLTEGSSVSAQKIISTGFEFEYPKVCIALEDLLAGND